MFRTLLRRQHGTESGNMKFRGRFVDPTSSNDGRIGSQIVYLSFVHIIFHELVTRIIPSVRC